MQCGKTPTTTPYSFFSMCTEHVGLVEREQHGLEIHDLETASAVLHCVCSALCLRFTLQESSLLFGSYAVALFIATGDEVGRGSRSSHYLHVALGQDQCLTQFWVIPK